MFLNHWRDGRTKLTTWLERRPQFQPIYPGKIPEFSYLLDVSIVQKSTKCQPLQNTIFQNQVNQVTTQPNLEIMHILGSQSHPTHPQKICM